MTGEVSKSMENDLHNDLKTPANTSSPTKDSIKSPHLTELSASTTLGTKKGGRYVQTKYGEVKMTEDGSKFECKVCQHTFTRIESVHQHMAIHDETLAMKCDLCDGCISMLFRAFRDWTCLPPQRLTSHSSTLNGGRWQ